jgi:hypothetical protein
MKPTQKPALTAIKHTPTNPRLEAALIRYEKTKGITDTDLSDDEWHIIALAERLLELRRVCNTNAALTARVRALEGIAERLANLLEDQCTGTQFAESAISAARALLTPNQKK